MKSGEEAPQATDPRRTLSRWALSFWGPLVFVLVMALSIVAWAVTKSGVDRENSDLLKNDAAQIQLLLQSTISGIQTQLRSVAYFTAAAADSPTVFAQQAATLQGQPGISVAVIELKGQPAGQVRVTVASGPDLHTGELLPAGLAAVVRAGSGALTGGLVHVGSTTLYGLATSPSVSPSSVTLETSRLDPNKPTPNRTGPYQKVYVDIYSSSPGGPPQKIVTTYGRGTLPKPVATSKDTVGALTWRVDVSPRFALIGSTAENAPWLMLGIGIVVAVVLTVFVELLARRQRYARRLVEERTRELVEAQRTLLRQERLAAVGEMASVVSHELRNPLSAVVNDLYLLRQHLGGALPPDGDRYLNNAEREIYRAARLSEDLLSYTRERTPQWATVDFASLVTDVLQSTPPPNGVEVRVDSTVSFDADPALMSQVLTNLVTNAYQAMPQGGGVRLAAERQNGGTVISVQDGGSGFDPDLAGQLFDPFFTTKEGGTGLGLAIVLRLVEAHGGTVSIENVDSGGARVQVRIADGGPAR